MSHADLPEIYLARHGETAWSISGQHTGLTDIPLTGRGEQNAASLGKRLNETTFSEVLTSPLVRARKTCDLAGFASQAKVDPDLVEWDYGRYEGRKTDEIHAEDPAWSLFRDGCPDGESLLQIGTRADRVVARLKAMTGRVLVFSHGHFCRILAARWIGQPAEDARHYLLGTASIGILGYEHNADEPVIKLWNDNRHLMG